MGKKQRRYNCKAQACAIQACISKTLDESKCEEQIRALHECCRQTRARGSDSDACQGLWQAWDKAAAAAENAKHVNK
ncbi:hypothetical protein M427DRAFT_129951 [Gonapodya prolifera JEL478]|uniref:Cx9C motif-containing protein 4, mitochondrial n=1 Tax=Gonapodya prolifera (strain JEL478) TaxID=1344416 RepID=A0A139AZQ0_GONPJ|nr:hypothetical protein M427DRAFT_129951 [Gonapodya prolifera JEL478]|eukprot:KXS22216.1 hypothetical protein M427DRAFT_129951 [Gonapodya prolifera JEL478]